MDGRANIRDVAALAGVAVKTVSRVLNDHPYVTAATRAKVEAAMKALDFEPSVAARILAGTKSGQIALIYDNHSPYYMNQIQAGCWNCCQRQGVRLLAQPVDVADPQIGEQVRQLIRQTHVDGLVLSSPVTDCVPVLKMLESLNVPFVRISPGTSHALTSSVFMDDVQAADDMTTHLLNLGHRRIGFVKGHPNHMATKDRLDGYLRALCRVGIAPDMTLVADGTFDFDSGLTAGRCFLALPVRPTAIFASNDDMAVGVQAAAHEAGLSMPEQLSVAGFDGTTLSRMVWPPLTTIAQPMQELAYTATTILLSGQGRVHKRLAHSLIERASTVAPEHYHLKD